MLCCSRSRSVLIIVLAELLFIPALFLTSSYSDTPSSGILRDILERECINLNKDKMSMLLAAQFGPELEKEPATDLLKIIEGVIKRTDFDSIAEEKTAEIIGLVHGAFKKGAPLDYLDDIFDVAYVNTITVDQLAAAAKALKEFHSSDVPQDIYEEFVYHSIEDRWDPAALPVYTRGLIYGVDRGLSPDKVALIIMLDAKNPEYANKPPEQMVMDSIKLVREKEPKNWKPMSQVEKDLALKKDKQRSLEQRKRELDNNIDQKERAFVQVQSELKELREYPGGKGSDVDMDKLNRDLERLLKNLQGEITKYQGQRGNIVAELEATKKYVDQQQDARDKERRTKQERALTKQHGLVSSAGKSGRLNTDKLNGAVNRLIGTPYRFGGDSERGIDCSAFTRRVYRSQNVELPRNSREQARVSSSVAYSSVRTGDLIFFDTSINGSISHVGVFLGGGTFAHASSSKGVTKSSLKEKYYVKRFVKGGRIFND
ncbi:MAG: NlpC/P60 family protein [Nitrospirota bacterium]